MKATITAYTEKPKVLATVKMNAEGVVACDNAEFMEDFERNGLLGPYPQLEKLHPKDGRKFMEALPVHFTGLIRAELEE